MQIENIQELIHTHEQQLVQRNNLKVKNYLLGKHAILQRKDFTFKNETFQTAKVLLQTIKSIVDFHTSYLVGNPLTLTGSENVTKLFNQIYANSHYAIVDFELTNNLVLYGNAYEYVYKESKAVKSKVIDPLSSYPIYDDKGNYIAFIEYWKDCINEVEYYVVYEHEFVTEYDRHKEKSFVLTNQYRNLTGLPIHYRSGVTSECTDFGAGIVMDLIPIMNEIESLLSKTVDAVSTLSLNPLGVSSGQKIASSIDKDMTGVILNLEDGGRFDYASATIDNQTVGLLLQELINQLYSVAQVPSVVFNGNVSNVSETSLKLLFTQLDNKAKRTATYFKQGIYTRFHYILSNIPLVEPVDWSN